MAQLCTFMCLSYTLRHQKSNKNCPSGQYFNDSIDLCIKCVLNESRRCQTVEKVLKISSWRCVRMRCTDGNICRCVQISKLGLIKTLNPRHKTHACCYFELLHDSHCDGLRCHTRFQADINHSLPNKACQFTFA